MCELLCWNLQSYSNGMISCVEKLDHPCENECGCAGMLACIANPAHRGFRPLVVVCFHELDEVLIKIHRSMPVLIKDL